MSNKPAAFTGEYRFLSNFYPCDIAFENVLYPSVENAYQAAKCWDTSDRIRFCSITAVQAKRLGKIVPIRDDWEEVKLFIMESLVKIKFSNNPSLKKLLIDTGHTYLAEENYWGDTYWGTCKGIGENRLGRILMTVRNELIREEQLEGIQ